MNARGRSMSWLETIHQICDLREPLTFHNDKSTDHGFLGEAPPPGCRSGQREPLYSVADAAQGKVNVRLAVSCGG